MKKLISVVAAAAVTMSVFSSFASAANLYSYYNEPGSFAEEDLNEYNVPKKDYVEVGLNIDLSWDNAEEYNPSIYKPFAYSATPTTAETTFDARAKLDMKFVAQEWEKILETASEKVADKLSTDTNKIDPAAMRARAIENTKLSGEFKITIEDTSSTPDSIVNVKGIDKDSSVLEWVQNPMNYRVTDFFEQKGDIVKEGNQYVITMALKDDAGINAALDKYFTDLAAAADNEKADYDLLLSIADSYVPVPVTPGVSYSYNVTGTFGGYIDIELHSDKVSQIWFGTGKTVEKTVEGNTEKVVENEPATATARITVSKASRGGGGGGGGSATRTTPAPTTTEAPTGAPTETTAPIDSPVATPVANPQISGNASGATLNYDDHFAYIIGYNLEEGETLAQVRPQANITRAEVATIFFRLLTDESRTRFWTKANSFSDVPAEEWFNNAISTDAKAGIMEGSDGRFRPNAPITRAEFATIAARFSSVVYNGEDKFSDISGHWAAEYINKAAETGWINGYEDGTFRPNANITRAEAMTLINRMVYRLVDRNSLVEAGMNKWSDNLDTSAWFYADVQEATNSHDYERTAIGYVEKWTANKAPRDWEALEKTWSEAASAGSEESVFTDSGLEELNTENTK